MLRWYLRKLRKLARNMVYFLAERDKNKPRTWSGTPLWLYTALSMKIGVIDIDTNESAVKCFCRKVLRRLLCINDMDVGKIRGHGKSAMRLLPAHGVNVVQIAAEVVPDTPSIQTYIYIDVSISYRKYMAENLPDVFAHLWFEWYPKASIGRRATMQDRYFQGCSGILTMCKWLANDLVERCRLLRGKVHHWAAASTLTVSSSTTARSGVKSSCSSGATSRGMAVIWSMKSFVS